MGSFKVGPAVFVTADKLPNPGRMVNLHELKTIRKESWKYAQFQCIKCGQVRRTEKAFSRGAGCRGRK
jgi:hypothetical protein